MSLSLLRLTFLLFGIKFLYSWYLFDMAACASPDRILGFLGVLSGDTRSYLEPIQHFFTEGSYYFSNAWGEIVYAGRMPLYGVIYFILDLWTLGNGYTALVLFQILLEAFAIAFLSRCLIYDKKTEGVGLAFLLIMTLSAYTTAWALKIQPESLSTSLIIILAGLYAKKKKSYWFVAIILLCLTMLKPYFGALYLIFAVKILAEKKKVIRELFNLSMPLILILGAWSFRNYERTETFIPLTQAYSGYAYTESELAMRKLAGDIGLGFESWDSKSFGHYVTHGDSNYEVPQFLENSDSYSKLIVLRGDYAHLISETKTRKDTSDRDSLLAKRIFDLNQNFNSELTGRHLAAPFLLSFQWLFHSGAYYYPIMLMDRTCGSIFSTMDKIFQSLLYYLVLISAPIGLFLSLWARDRLTFYSIFILSFLFLLFPVYLRFIELRYFLQAFPLLVIGFALLFKKTPR